jgi:transcriptional regulator with PAS, ATPase and Fis domain
MQRGDIVFASEAMEATIRTARGVASTSSPVLIEGESGTGKELIARLIHSLSDRRERPFIPVNCGAIPETLFESEAFGHRAGAFTGAIRDKQGIFETASGGTLFLDEIGDLPRPLQAKCLRVLQENELRRVGDTRLSRIDVRLISATNRDLEREMKAGRFREDLFFRIGVIRIHIEPLRRRKEDIPALVRHFAAKHAGRLGKHVPRISKEVLMLFEKYAWPGNARELENEIHRIVALFNDGRPVTALGVSPRIVECAGRRDREDHSGNCGELKMKLACYERQIIKEALNRYGWNKTRTARHLGLTRQGLHRKLRRLRIRGHESS